jgi:hypothetical protein
MIAHLHEASKVNTHEKIQNYFQVFKVSASTVDLLKQNRELSILTEKGLCEFRWKIKFTFSKFESIK